jgi:hypothetical protein
MPAQSTTALSEHFTPHATLAALGAKLVALGFFDPVEQHVRIAQKTVKDTPTQKLYDAFICLLAGAHGLVAINTRLRSDPALQRAFGRHRSAEQSVVQDTLDACMPDNVAQMRLAFESILARHSLSYHHDYRRQLQVLDVDLTGCCVARRPKAPRRATSRISESRSAATREAASSGASLRRATRRSSPTCSIRATNSCATS